MLKVTDPSLCDDDGVNWQDIQVFAPGPPQMPQPRNFYDIIRLHRVMVRPCLPLGATRNGQEHACVCALAWGRVRVYSVGSVLGAPHTSLVTRSAQAVCPSTSMRSPLVLLSTAYWPPPSSQYDRNIECSCSAPLNTVLQWNGKHAWARRRA